MKVMADLDLCQGYANCVIEAPEVFDIDEVGNKVIVLVPAPGSELHEDVRRAVASCPVKALSIEE